MLQTSSLHVVLVQGPIKLCIKTLETHSNIETKVTEFCVSHDVQVAVTKTPQKWLRSTKRSFINKLTQNINERFQDHPIMASYSTVFACNSNKEIVGGTGIETANTLENCALFLASHIPRTCMQSGLHSPTSCLSDCLLFVAHDFKQLFPLIARIAGSCLVLPQHMVDCETCRL